MVTAPPCDDSTPASPKSQRYAWLRDPLNRTHLCADDLEHVVEHPESVSDSERVPDGTPPVPALLRLVECVNAALAADRQLAERRRE